jgi:hypothetical protein
MQRNHQRRCVCRSGAGACAALSQKFVTFERPSLEPCLHFPKPLRDDDTRKELQARLVRIGRTHESGTGFDRRQWGPCIPIDADPAKKPDISCRCTCRWWCLIDGEAFPATAISATGGCCGCGYCETQLHPQN